MKPVALRLMTLAASSHWMLSRSRGRRIGRVRLGHSTSSAMPEKVEGSHTLSGNGRQLDLLQKGKQAVLGNLAILIERVLRANARGRILTPDVLQTI